MMTLDTINETYRSRIDNPECYVRPSDAVQGGLDYEVRRYGIQDISAIAHGVLAFCVDNDAAVCLPWLIAPDAPPKDIIGGRHGFVYDEFYQVAESAGLSSYKYARDGVDYDDLIGMYLVKNPANESLFSVICDDTDLSKITTSEKFKLIEEFTVRNNDHQVLTQSEDGENDAFLKIREGTSIEIPYGRVRGMRLPTIAKSGDILGKSRELDNYATYAQKHSLDKFEFATLTSKAVEAFQNGRQVSLDNLCIEIISKRGMED